jgi:uncharacterized protein (TIGR00299 family) protein
MRIAYFDCYSGISGNMALGATLDAGAGEGKLREILAGLRIKDFRLRVKKEMRQSLAGTFVQVVNLARNPRERHLSDIQKLINRSRIHLDIKEKSIHVFQRLARAEARVHRKTADEIHFHEVGAVDAIIDVVGTVAGLWLLKVDRVYASPLPLGSGEVECEHGRLPVPAPATLELLKGVPVIGDQSGLELVTPTGAALISSLAEAFGPIPAMRLEGVGYGLGTRDIPSRPNLLRLILGQILEASESVIQIEANLDDMSPEYYDFLIQKLFSARALDVALIPVQMKKNRPGILISVLANSKDYTRVIEILLNHSSTLGVRYHELMRTSLVRKSEVIHTRFGKIRAKRAFRPDGSETLHPEYDDLKKAADRSGITLAQVEQEFRGSTKKDLPRRKRR